LPRDTSYQIWLKSD